MTVIIGNHAEYNKSLAEIDDCVADLEELQGLLTVSHKRRLKALVGKEESQRLTITEVDKQFALVKKLRDQVIDNQGNILDDAGVRELASLVSSINALIGLFLKNESLIDHAREKYNLQEAVLHAISGLSKEEQALFFERMGELEQ